MKKLNITKREIVFFFLGLVTMFIFEIIFDWKEVKSGFQDGYNDARNEAKK